MKVVATRHDAHPGDDPVPLEFTVAEDAPPQDVIRRAAEPGWLPSIAGGKATWSVVSDGPLAVVAQQWSEPRYLPFIGERWLNAPRRDGALRLHFNYHAQSVPEDVYRMLWGMKFRA
jgi:hypothetical protein